MIRELAAQDIKWVIQQIETWVEGRGIDFNKFLKHTYIQNPKFHKTQAKIIYRTLSVPNSAVNDSAARPYVFKEVKMKRIRDIIAFSESKLMSRVAYQDFEKEGHSFTYAKKLNPDDLLLNFSAVLRQLKKDGHKMNTFSGYDSGDRDEQELWIKPTPYYTTFSPKEVVK